MVLLEGRRFWVLLLMRRLGGQQQGCLHLQQGQCMHFFMDLFFRVRLVVRPFPVVLLERLFECLGIFNNN